MLREQAAQTMRAAYAAGTLRNFETQQKLYLDFCDHFKIKAVPADTDTLVVYMEFLARKFKSAQVIGNYLQGVKALHIFNNADVSTFEHLAIKLMMKGLARQKRHIPKQAAPITPDILLAFRSKLDMRDPNDVSFWALFLLAFFLMARKSNLVPDGKNEFDAGKQLIRSDIQLNRQGLLISIKWSKTLQLGGRIHRVPLLAMPNSVLCPKEAYTKMCKMVPGRQGDPVFKVKEGKKWVPLTYYMYQCKLKALCTEVGLDANAYSSHSFRRGGATFASEAGVPRNVIMLIGDWRSAAVDRYIDCTMGAKVSAAQLIRHRLMGGSSK